jgi:hypothetical protein
MECSGSWRQVRALVVVVLLGAVAVSWDVRPAHAAPTADRCETTFIGAHGLYEDAPGKTVQATWGEFASRTESHPGQPGPVAQFLNHPKLDAFSFVRDVIKLGHRNPINFGVDLLNEAVQHAEETCSPSRVVLMGYSEGAWIVDAWLARASAEQKAHVVAVGVLGDPQWQRAEYEGIARRHRFGLNPWPNVPDRFWGGCAGNDPICGEGYGKGHAEQNRQDQDAERLTPKNCAAHCSYVRGGTTWLADALADRAAQ